MQLSENLLVHQLFERQAILFPNRIAVTFEDQFLSYHQLNLIANQFAHLLVEKGIGPGSLVAICLERGLELIYTLMAVLKSGAAYLPLDPEFPNNRLNLMLNDSQPSLLITSSKFRGKFGLQNKELYLESLHDELLTRPSDNIHLPLSLQQPIYMIYTSGSTGKPKAVLINHLSLINFLKAMQIKIDIGENENFLALTTISFDISLLEIFLPLLSANLCVITSRNIAVIGEDLDFLIQTTKITILQATPSTWELLLASGWRGKKHLKMLCGGEKLSERLAQRLIDKGEQLWNVYGPTETTVWSTCAEVQLNLPITIGRPLLNTEVYVLDEYVDQLPIGAWGELVIGGMGVAIGYFNLPDWTAERFSPDPYSSREGSRLYKTGDIGRYLSNGQLECSGRNDHQIKYLGYRIEPGDIEAAIAEDKRIYQVVVVLNDQQSDKALVAYIVKENKVESESFVQTLRKHLEKRLPIYMIPRHFIILEKLPLTANGKINRRALPDPSTTINVKTNYPEDPIQASIHSIWSQILHLTDFGIDDSFFKIGGHSLLAIQVIYAIREKYGIEVPLRDLFAYPTVRKISEKLQIALKSEQKEEHSIKANKRVTGIPLSLTQQRLWITDQFLKENGIVGLYNIPLAFSFVGPLNIPLLKQALSQIMERHEVLRYYLINQEGDITQNIAQEINPNLKIIDFSTFEKAQQQVLINKYLQEESRYPFDLSTFPLIRTTLILLEEQKHFLIIIFHHIISDAWSLEIFCKELGFFYNDPKAILHPLPVQYSDFAIWQQDWFKGFLFEHQLNYWKEQLKDIPKIIQLPWDKSRIMQPTYQGAVYTHTFSTNIIYSLRELCEKNEVSLFMAILTIFKVLLFRYSNQNDLVVGIPIANRRLKDTQGLIGFFINSIPIRTQLKPNMNFKELLQLVREKVLEGYENQDIPFEQIVDQLQLPRDSSHHPVFQVMFLFDAYKEPASKSLLHLDKISVKEEQIANNTSKFDLTLWMREAENQISMGFEYATDLFEERTIQKMASHLQLLIETILVQQDCPILQLSLLTTEEELLIQSLCATTQTEFPHLLLPQLFERQVEKTPDKIAIFYENKSLTYINLNARANCLANLLKEIGVVPEKPVGILLERSLETIIVVLAILKAGGCYVPIESEFPDERIDYIIQDTQLHLIITDSTLIHKLRNYKGENIQIDQNWDHIHQKNNGNINSRIHPLNRAFILYTSGSTGQPKGVEGHYFGLMNRSNWMIRTYPFTVEDIFIQKTSLTIVDSFFEIFDPLITGASLAISSNETLKDLEKFILNLQQYAISRIIFVPTLLEALLDEFYTQFAGLKSLKYVLIGGEAVTTALARRLKGVLSNVSLINLFGATETTAEVLYQEVGIVEHKSKNIAIGKPIANSQSYLLNESLLPCPKGVIGEIYVGGQGLTRGYLNLPKLTAEKFIPHPFNSNPGERLYRMGDFGKYLLDESIEYIGRKDFQIKIRGFRVESAEIETYLNQYPNILQSVVAVHQSSLIAYVQSKNKKTLEVSSLRQYLAERLPLYMVPDIFIEVDKFKQTTTGKIDRKKLPIPNEQFCSQRYIHPRNEIEFYMSKIWENLLNRSGIGVFDNFFEIGGNSLLLMRLLAQIRKKFGRSLSVTQAYRNSTIAHFSQYLKIERKNENPLIEIQSTGTKDPLYLIHPAMGLSFVYQLLGSFQQDRCIYGINNPYFGEKECPYKTIEEMAKKYIDLIPLPSEQNYILGGWSFGGIIAYEMAQQLKQLNRGPGLILLIDSFNTIQFGEQDSEEKAEDVNEFLLNYGIEELSSEYEGAKNEIENNVSLAMKYYPKPYTKDIVLIKASIAEKYNQKAVEDPFNGWRDIVTGNIEVLQVPCKHGEMFDKDFSPLTSQAIKKALDVH